jgi:hypothetical protein
VISETLLSWFMCRCCTCQLVHVPLLNLSVGSCAAVALVSWFTCRCCTCQLVHVPLLHLSVGSCAAVALNAAQ